MLNSEPDSVVGTPSREAAVNDIVRAGSRGAIVLAGLSTAVVIALWFAFYLLVFVPRAVAP